MNARIPAPRDKPNRTPPARDADGWLREELISLLSVSGTLAGLCITVVALMKTIGKAASVATIVDDLFAICALLFLVCVYLIFAALRVRQARIGSYLLKLVDIAFLVALTLMTGAAFILVYTLW